MSMTYTIKSEAIYPAGYRIPDGYEILDFRPPKKGEDYIQSGGELAGAGSDFLLPRIVVRQKRRKVVKFVEDPQGKYFQKVDGLFIECPNYGDCHATKAFEHFRREESYE